MIKTENNFAYIDGANLDKAVRELGWSLDYKRFRIWLSEKYAAKRAYIFIGLIPKYKNLYTYLQECGFTLIFKNQKSILEVQNKKAPNADETASGSSS